MTSEEIKKITSAIDYTKNFMKSYNNLLLTEEQYNTLKKYCINVEECGSMTELLYLIDEVLYENDSPELEMIAEILQERNYYENTNK